MDAAYPSLAAGFRAAGDGASEAGNGHLGGGEMAQWLAKLDGHEFDKKDLNIFFTEPTCRVALDDDGAYYLTSDTFAPMANASEVRAAAEDMLRILNDLMRYRDQGYQLVSLVDVARSNDDGTHSVYVFISGHATGRARASLEITVTDAAGQPVPSPEPNITQARLKLAQQDTRVRMVLSLWRNCTPTDAALWIYLYKIYEIIGAEMAGGDKNQIKQALERAGWATSAESLDFGEAANNPDVTGEYARHAAGWKTRPGVTPMNADQAITFIRHLTNLWLNDKMKQAP